MLKSQVKIHTLCSEISKYDAFVLYGAGDIAECLMEVLREKNCQPLYGVVTDKSKNSKSIKGLNIYDFKEKLSELQEKNILVIVSVISHLHEKEIVSMLLNCGIVNILLASDICFFLNKKIFEDVYIDKEFAWYVPRVEDWYMEQHGSIFKISSLRQEVKENSNRVVIVIENFSPRVIKIAKALKTSGKDVMVFLGEKLRRNPMWRICYDALQKENIEYLLYGSIEELIFTLLQSKGSIIHIFSNPWNPYTAYILVKLQQSLGKVVFENYDIANGFYINLDEAALNLERYCIENARGISHREYSLGHLIDNLGFKIQGHAIRFFDYCSDETVDVKENNQEKELSICYVGGVVTEDEYDDCPFGSFMEIAERCEKNKCHLHIYSVIWDEKRYRKYIEKDGESKYFHFHRPVSYDRLAEEISQYDYGINPARDDIWEKECSGYNTKKQYIYAGANKHFDYLDAGLPIIAAIPQKISRYLEQKGVLINWTNGQYDFNYMRKMKETMRENVVKVREELRMGNHIQELIEFYETL